MAHLEQTVAGEVRRVPLDGKTITYIGNENEWLTLAAADAKPLAAFYPSRRYFVLLSLGGPVVFANDCKVSLLKIVREGDHVAIGPHAVVFREMVTEVLGEDSPLITSGKICLVDRAPFKAGDRVVYCPACHTPHHERCWTYQKGRCANGRLCLYQAPWDEDEPKAT